MKKTKMEFHSVFFVVGNETNRFSLIVSLHQLEACHWCDVWRQAGGCLWIRRSGKRLLPSPEGARVHCLCHRNWSCVCPTGMVCTPGGSLCFYGFCVFTLCFHMWLSTHIHEFMCTYIHTCLHTYIPTYLPIYVYTYIYAWLYDNERECW